jgi:hypothetical protein
LGERRRIEVLYLDEVTLVFLVAGGDEAVNLRAIISKLSSNP